MPTPVNLADPSFEPSDDDLARLMHDAFGGLREAHEASLREMRARIQRLQAEARRRFAEDHASDRRE